MARSPRITIAILILVLLPALAAAADPPPVRMLDPDGVLHGAVPGAVKTAVDSFLLMGPTGSGAPYVGDFESASGCAWNGWTSVDHTAPTETHWHVSDFMPVSGALSAWCGDPGLPSCGGDDPAGGYGNNWVDMLEWRAAVADPQQTTNLQIHALMDVDTEPGYDFVYVSVEKSELAIPSYPPIHDVLMVDGKHSGLVVDEPVSYLAGEYVGDAADEVVVLIRFESDGAWSDEDCSYPSAGAVRVDDVTITSDNGASTGPVDFEDGTFGSLAVRYPTGVGDFAKLWRGLDDVDPCRQNATCQVAFIDDGLVVLGTGGTLGTTWVYGPGGYVLNTEGGLLGPTEHLNNSVVSPPMAWPVPAHQGCLLEYDMWAHEPLGGNSPGMFPTWGVRWTASADPADLESEPWGDYGFLSLYPVGEYLRLQREVDPLMPPQPQWMQVKLGVYEAGWIWGWTGTDATPAPYYDNVRVTTYERVGPSLTTRELELAQDTFPAGGTLDLGDPGSLSCRFDMARNISEPSHLRIDPGDSLVASAEALGLDTVVEDPRLHYKVFRNPVFAPYVTAGLPDEGDVDGHVSTNASGTVVPGRFWFDLPDTGFLFPGDVVHYFLAASQRDTLTSQVTTAYLPADTTAFSYRDGTPGSAGQAHLTYDRRWTMRCLPTVKDLAGDQPTVLLWYDQKAGDWDEWSAAFQYGGWAEAANYDCYTTRAAASFLGNGLGARATTAQLAGYESIVYTSGILASGTLGNGDFNYDPSPDIERLTDWLDGGDRGLFATGDGLASDLQASGVAGQTFLADVLGVSLAPGVLENLIGGQVSPRVLITPSNPVFSTVSSWVAYGGCPYFRPFDAVETAGAGQRVAVFADPSGQDGGYSYSAATAVTGVGAAGTSRVVSLPYDLAAVRTDPDEGAKAEAGAPARARVLIDVLAWQGQSGGGVAGTRDAASLTVGPAPNPFNPMTTLRYTVPAPGRLTLKVYDLRGRLVRTVLDRRVTTSGKVAWDGRDDHGAQVASGVYFYEARLDDARTVGKLTVVR